MAENTIRWKVISRIAELARQRAELDGVTIDPAGFPGDLHGSEAVYLSDLQGSLNVPVTRTAGERVTYDDDFTITWAIDVFADGKDRDDTMARADEIVAAMQDVIANDCQLGQLDGLVTARLNEQRGPIGIDVQGVGLVVHAQLFVQIHARYSS